MRRQFLLLVIILVGTATLVAAQEGQPQPTDQPTGEPLQVAPTHMVSGAWQPVEIERIDAPPAAILQLADPASDSCSDAPDLDLGFVGGDGGQTITNSAEILTATQADTDSTPNNDVPAEDDQGAAVIASPCLLGEHLDAIAHDAQPAGHETPLRQVEMSIMKCGCSHEVVLSLYLESGQTPKTRGSLKKEPLPHSSVMLSDNDL